MMFQKNIILFGLLELILVVIITTISLKLWTVDFQVPFNYQGDTLWFLVPIKGMVDNGWTYDIPQLSAPFSLSAAAFPSMTNLDWIIMKVISLFVNDAGAVLNLFWLFSIILTAWTATLALRLLGLGNWLAIALGLLYSFLPATFMRNTAHISLVFYCVPLLCLFVVHLMCGGDYKQSNIIRKIGYLGALAQGFNYIYFSFFALILFIFGGWFGYKEKHSSKSLRDAAIASSIIILSSVINLLPFYVSLQTHGKSPYVSFKSPQEAEIYGLKLRQMLVPHEDNIVPIFSHWAKRDKSIPFPNENENVAARLGPFAALGFLFLVAISLKLVRFNTVEEEVIVKPIALLVLLSFLITTVGGFGAIFNELISPDIRCYNRFSVFIAFFSIAGLGIWLQGRLKASSSYQTQLTLLGLIVLLIGFSLYDQLLNATPLNKYHPHDQRSAYSEKQFIKELEAKLPLETSVYQLPTIIFAGSIKERMYPYDHARPYLWSSHLRWSWPSLSLRHQNWQNQIDSMEGEELVTALVLSNFRIVWIDRFGYSDNGTQIISRLTDAGANDILPGSHSRYVALDLESVRVRLRQRLGAEEFARHQTALLEAPLIEWISGVYPTEYNPSTGKEFRWSRAESSIKIRNPTNISKSVILSFLIASGRQGDLSIIAGEKKIKVFVTGEPKRVELSLELEPNAGQELRFKGDMGRIPLPAGETRDLHFYLMDVRFQVKSIKAQN